MGRRCFPGQILSTQCHWERQANSKLDSSSALEANVVVVVRVVFEYLLCSVMITLHLCHAYSTTFFSYPFFLCSTTRMHSSSSTEVVEYCARLVSVCVWGTQEYEGDHNHPTFILNVCVLTCFRTKWTHSTSDPLERALEPLWSFVCFRSTLIQISPSSAAYRSGLFPGDIILGIDNSPITGRPLTYSVACELIRRALDSIELQVLREPANQIKQKSKCFFWVSQNCGEIVYSSTVMYSTNATPEPYRPVSVNRGVIPNVAHQDSGVRLPDNNVAEFHSEKAREQWAITKQVFNVFFGFFSNSVLNPCFADIPKHSVDWGQAQSTSRLANGLLHSPHGRSGLAFGTQARRSCAGSRQDENFVRCHSSKRTDVPWTLELIHVNLFVDTQRRCWHGPFAV